MYKKYSKGLHSLYLRLYRTICDMGRGGLSFLYVRAFIAAQP